MSWAQPPGTPPPGWYPDPSGSGRQRWWDGTRWTEHYAGGPQAQQAPAYAPPPGYGPAPGYAQPPAAKAAKHGPPPPVFWAVPIAAVAVIVGSVGTWVTVKVSALGSGFSQSAGGLDDGGDGWLTLIAGVLAAALLAIWALERVVALAIVAAVIAAVSTVIALYHVADPSTGTDVPALVDVGAGWGAWLAFLGSLVLTGVAVLLAIQTGRRTA